MNFSRKVFYKIFIAGLVVFVLVFVFVVLSNFLILSSGKKFIYQGDNRFANVPKAQTALVLGARVYQNGSMSPIFEDRAKVALRLYQEGKVQKILVSGDHGRKNYDEVNAAKEFFLDNGVPGEDVFLDHAGFDTYDSLYRARAVFQAESLIVCTQDFHLPRAVYIGRKLGLEVYGISADLQPYLGSQRWELRENAARVKAFVNALFKVKPKFLGPAIPLSGESSKSWD
jgi:vancomycin permeability regulator SanA